MWFQWFCTNIVSQLADRLKTRTNGITSELAEVTLHSPGESKARRPFMVWARPTAHRRRVLLLWPRRPSCSYSAATRRCIPAALHIRSCAGHAWAPRAGKNGWPWAGFSNMREFHDWLLFVGIGLCSLATSKSHHRENMGLPPLRVPPVGSRSFAWARWSTPTLCGCSPL